MQAIDTVVAMILETIPSGKVVNPIRLDSIVAVYLMNNPFASFEMAAQECKRQYFARVR